MTRRYLWTSSVATQQQQDSDDDGDVARTLDAAHEHSVQLLHQSIPVDVDKPVSFDVDAEENSGDRRLPTLAASTPASHLHTPYALWAHGHLLFLHHSLHGYKGMEDESRRFSQHDIPVDAIVLDAYWWHPSRFLEPHPQLYERGWKQTSSGAPKVVLWVSALVPTSSRDYIEGRQRHYFLHRGDKTSGNKNTSDTPHIFEWGRKDGPALHGALVDFTNVQAVTWLANKFETLLRENPQVFGVRCAGVDALVEHTTDLFGGIGHIDSSLYRSMYYRFFLDIGRKVRGPTFLMMGRAVDSFGSYHYQKFAPRDSLFAGFVGDHPFTFSGLRESAMNVIHSAYHCYVNIGVVVGGSYATLPQTAESFREAEEQSSMVDLGLHDTQQLSNRLQRSYREAELFPVVMNNHAGGGDTQCSSVVALRQSRERELFLRWVQFGAMLPFLINGGGDRYNSLLSSSSSSSSVVATTYRTLVNEHRALALYYSTEAIDSLDHFFDSEFHYQNVPFKTKTSKLREDPRAQHCSIMPLRKIPVSFAEPNSAEVEWALRVGDHLIVIPVLHSFGSSSERRIPLQHLLQQLDISLLNAAGSSTTTTTPTEWVLVSDISNVFVLDGRIKHQHDAFFHVPAPTGAPLVLRRRDAIIPLVLPIATSTSPTMTLVAGDVVIFSLDSPRGADKNTVAAASQQPQPLMARTRTTLTGEQDAVIPAMQTTVSRRSSTNHIDASSEGELLNFEVKFLSDENDKGEEAADDTIWNSWFSDDEEENTKFLWDSSLRFVFGYSEATSVNGKLLPVVDMPSPTCRCLFEPESLDEDHTRADVECAVASTQSTEDGHEKNLRLQEQGSQFLHRRHRVDDATLKLLLDDQPTTKSDEALRCVVRTSSRASALKVQQLLVASPIHGEVRCSCSQW